MGPKASTASSRPSSTRNDEEELHTLGTEPINRSLQRSRVFILSVVCETNFLEALGSKVLDDSPAGP